MNGEPARAEVDQPSPQPEAELELRFARRVRYLACRYVPPEWVDDVVQDTLIAVTMALRNGRLRHAEALPGFVLGTARNVISNLLRRESLRRAHVSIEEMQAQSSKGSDPLQQLITDERRRSIAACLSRLRDEDRRVLFLAFYEGMPPREIARVLNISPAVARNRKSRAVQRFARIYTDEQRRNGVPDRQE